MKKLIKNRIAVIILIYTIVGIILPFGFKYIIFENTALSHLINNEWAGFLGSYVGGILGGLGTLISVYITVKDSRDMQAENKKDTDKQISDNRKERDIERKEDRKLMEQRERKEFVDNTADYIGKYITYNYNYCYASKWEKGIEEKLQAARAELDRVENELVDLDGKGKEQFSSDTYERKRNRLLDKKSIIEREYEKQQREKERNSVEGNRTQTNECYYILQTKLCNIEEAKDVLDQLYLLQKDTQKHVSELELRWLDDNTELLIEKYNEFIRKFVENALKDI